MVKAATDPFSPEAPADEVEKYDESGDQYDGGPEASDSGLGDAAGSAFGDNLEGLSGSQEELDGMDFTKARFVGMSYDSLDRDINIGDEITFLVQARCVGKGDEERKTDHRINTYVKMDVQSVVIKGDSK